MNRGKNAVEVIKSIFISFGSRCDSATISKPQTISKAALTFANRYRYLKNRTTL